MSESDTKFFESEKYPGWKMNKKGECFRLSEPDPNLGDRWTPCQFADKELKASIQQEAEQAGFKRIYSVNGVSWSR